ncbi:hypothetical protein RQP46_000102 [Phenoliferia psychrophenolica]
MALPPVVDKSSGPVRTRKAPLASTASAANSPTTTRSGRVLGSIGSKSGPGFSPYARKTFPRGAVEGAYDSPARDDDELELGNGNGGGASGSGSVGASSGGGLVGTLKGLPGKAIGWMWRGGRKDSLAANGSTNGPPRSQSLADLQDEARLEATGASRGRGLPTAPATAPRKGIVPPPPRRQLPSSASMGALPPALSLRRPIPSFDPPRMSTSGPFHDPNERERLASPALSTTSSFTRDNRSPSPTRAGLSGSLSLFNLSANNALTSNLPQSPSSSLFNPRPSAYGLKSRSPFLSRGSPHPPSRLGSPSVRSVSSSSLFPYSSTVPRGANTSFSQALQQPQSPGGGMKRSYSDAGGSPPPRRRERYASPLNPYAGSSASVAGDGPAMKRQLVWDPEKGLVSREALQREADKARAALPMPKNDAERILEVLEGMGRTPMGEAKRAPNTKPKINVPTPSYPTTNPYARPSTSSQSQRPGTGLNSVFRAREERRQAEREQERERREAEERRLRAEEDAEDEMEVLREEQEMAHAREERRTTRSMAKSPVKSPRRAPASASKGKSTAASKGGKGKGRGTREPSEALSDREDSRMDSRQSSRLKSPEPSSSRRVKSPSPAPARVASPPPPSPPAQTSVPPEPVKAANGPSSLRPGKSHTSRKHVTSSKVFSAREEDLPPVDDDDLGKIQMPMFPEGFSFAPKPTSTAASSSSTAPSSTAPSAVPAPVFQLPPKMDAPVVTDSIFGRMGAPPPSLPTPAAPVAVSAPATTKVPLDFFSKPSAPLGNPLGTTKPSFFSNVLDTTKSSTPPAPVAPTPSFSFAAAPVPSKSVEETSSAPAPTAVNPFAGFGKPIAEVVKDDTASSSSSNTGFGGASLFGAKPNGEAKSPFGQPAETKSTTPSPFGSAGSTSAPPFGLFGSTPVPASSSTAASSPFAFSAPPAAPKPADEAKTSANPFAFNAAPTSVPAVEDTADEDSGMEDESVEPVAPKAAAPSFSFGNAAFPSSNGTGSGTSSPAPTSTGFSFGAAPATSAPPTFGALPSANGATPSLFGNGASNPSPLFGAPASGTTTPSLAFGGAATSHFGSGSGSGTTTPTFGFGAVSSAPPSPGGIFNAPGPAAASNIFGAPSAAASSTGNIFGGTSSGGGIFGAPASTSPFGAAPATQSFGGFGASSATMSQTHSAPSFGAGAPAFGSTLSAPFGAAPSPFGASSSAPSPFGASASSNGGGGGFSFGTPTSGAAPAAPASPFAFGGGAPAGAGASPFAFGGGGSPSPFGASPAPVSAAPGTPNLFSIGSGGDESLSPNKRVVRSLPGRRKK